MYDSRLSEGGESPATIGLTFNKQHASYQQAISEYSMNNTRMTTKLAIFQSGLNPTSKQTFDENFWKLVEFPTTRWIFSKQSNSRQQDYLRPSRWILDEPANFRRADDLQKARKLPTLDALSQRLPARLLASMSVEHFDCILSSEKFLL